MKKNNPFRILAIVAVAFLSLLNNPSFSQSRKKAKLQPDVKITLNAYSFNDLLLAKHQKDNQSLYTLFNLMEWCASQKIEGIDLTGYYFPGYPAVPSDDYILQLRNKAKQLGIVITGTGIRNNFASPDPAVRAADIELAKKWVVVAEKLGAPVLRVFAGEIPKGYEDKWDEVAGWMIDAYKQCAVEGEKHGVKIGIQNHGDMLQTADQCLKVLKGVDNKWAGLIVDTGNFKTADPYVDIEITAPYAVNWQIKESAFGIGSPIRTDSERLMQIFKKTGVKGYFPIETILLKGIAYDPFVLVPALMQELNIARDKVYK